MNTVYSKVGCPRCRVLKMKMEQKGIEYEECQDMEKMIGMGFKSLPMLEIDGKTLTFEEAVKYINER